MHVECELDAPSWTRVVRHVARSTEIGQQIALEGPLGAGKTTFAHALLEAWGWEPGLQGSPTYGLVQEYSPDQRSDDGTRPEAFYVLHLDLYRIKRADELLYLGMDAWALEHAIVLVEWSDRIPAEAWKEIWRVWGWTPLLGRIIFEPGHNGRTRRLTLEGFPEIPS